MVNSTTHGSHWRFSTHHVSTTLVADLFDMSFGFGADDFVAVSYVKFQDSGQRWRDFNPFDMRQHGWVVAVTAILKILLPSLEDPRGPGPSSMSVIYIDGNTRSIALFLCALNLQRDHD